MTNTQNNVKYATFNLFKLFDEKVQRGTRLVKSKRIPGNIPLVTAGEANRGVAAWIKHNKVLFPANSLTIDMFGNAFYRDQPFFADDNILVLASDGKYSDKVMLYMSAQVRTALQDRFNYGHQFRQKSLRSVIISLPVTPLGTPDFEYMEERIRELEEERIRELEEERIRELEAYLKVTSLSDATLTKADQDALDKMNMGGVKQAKFKVGSLFDIQKVRGINKSGLTVPNDNNCYDYVTRTSKDNGVESQTGLVKARELNEAGTYSLGLLQMTFFYRNKPWYAGQFVRKIVPKQKLSQKAMLYFLSIFNKMRPVLLSTLVRHVDDKFTSLEIDLPVTSLGDIDFDFMENYITAIEKQSIRGVIEYKDKMIQTTKNMVNVN